MGRKRTKNTHLPRRMYLRRGAYYFCHPVTDEWHPLGRDLEAAFAAYGKLVSGTWQGQTMGQAIDRYRTEILPLKRSAQTRTDQAKQLERLKEVFGEMPPDKITAQHCYQYLDARSASPVAAKHEMSLLGHVFAKAIRWGAATRNPVRTLERSAKSKRTRYITDAEYAAVYALASPRMQVAMELALLTGQRRGDLLTLKRSQLTDEGIVFKQSKTGAGVLVEWTDELRKVIDRAKATKPQIPGEYLLRKRNGRAYSARGFSAIWQRLMAKAMKPGKNGEPPALAERFTFHDLRAKCASDIKALEDAATLLGHASSNTTKSVYRRKMPRYPATLSRCQLTLITRRSAREEAAFSATAHFLAKPLLDISNRGPWHPTRHANRVGIRKSVYPSSSETKHTDDVTQIASGRQYLNQNKIVVHINGPFRSVCRVADCSRVKCRAIE
jgi:integrase